MVDDIKKKNTKIVFQINPYRIDHMNMSVCLLVLDGWGHNTPSSHNAISQANTPYYDQLVKQEQFCLLHASESWVGLPEGQFGNSEIGHMTIGSGRMIPSDLIKIDHILEDTSVIDFINSGDIHILGLCSSGGVHSHIRHITTLIKQLISTSDRAIFIHLITDGRDRPIQSFKDDSAALFHLIENHPDRIKIASIAGRYFAMDRDRNWDRTQMFIDAMVSDNENNLDNHLSQHYKDGLSDEFIAPQSISPCTIKTNDTVIACNFRADRFIQILERLQDQYPASYVGFTDYPGQDSMPCLFPKEPIKNTLGEVISQHGLKQLRIAETEKYAHVTYFFNALNHTPYSNETRVLIPSVKVPTFDQSPAMSAHKITEKLIEEISEHHFTVCNFANADMVGHTGNLSASIEAVEILDQCLKAVHTACIEKNIILIVTADHGNADQMLLANGEKSTSHSLAKVPFILCGAKRKLSASNNASLSNIAPTILSLLELPIPDEMHKDILE
tara:strand:- start:13260 stop:14762 length:1503 start_codon:yes stop_codon:yes gene_type:complete